ncbi:uncharacterized protein LOC123528983 [Mercenaria mercenaria]|uniref:uncharacterized protein LOC123528983 n=1 Tax=Mercenaria mercenaria TaxID=6596 RepID=UPI00234EB30D|nr:uncharacterized protein LOC123528983 [Mercenaria mercenaria]
MLKHLGILLSIKLFLVCAYGSSCPLDWSLSQVMKCLQNVTYGVNGTNVLAGTDTSTIHMFCEDGTLNQSVECLDNLYNKCGASNSLAMLAVPKLWRSAVEKLCSSLSDHDLHNMCIVHLRPTIKSCLSHNDVMFQKSLQNQETWKTLKIKICGYFEGMRICTAEPVIKNCDAGVGQTLSDFMSSISPRMCKPNYTHAGSDTSEGARVSNTLCFRTFLQVLLSFLFIQLCSSVLIK